MGQVSRSWTTYLVDWRAGLLTGGIALLGFWTPAATAQSTGDITYLRQPVFRIPIQVAPSKRDDVKELRLFVSVDRGRSWKLMKTAEPTERAFTFKAQADGEYWFTLAHVDRKGNVEPEDVSKERPGLRVLLDTKSPTVELRSQPGERGAGVSWRLVDEAIDLQSLKVEVRERETDPWRELPVSKTEAGKYEWPAEPGTSYLARVTVKDLAGNESVMETSAGVERPNPTFSRTPSRASEPVESVVESGRPSSAPRRLDWEESGFQPPAPPAFDRPINSTRSAATFNTGVPRTPLGSEANRPGSGPSVIASDRRRPERREPEPRSFEPATAASNRHSISDEYVVVASDQTPPRGPTTTEVRKIPVAQTASPSPQPAAPPRGASSSPTMKPRLVNSRRFKMHYELSDVGPAGVGTVELHFTEDEGKSWKLYGDDPDRVPPFDVTLPKEGRYGLYVSVLNPAKVGERPKPGTAPHLIVEVDTTPPDAELYEPRSDPNIEHGLLISWKSKDRHLPSRPVSLYFTEKPNGDLYPIATGLPPEGEHSWVVPAGIPYQVHLVLRAEDLIGNMSQAVTGEPILVDFSKPKAGAVEIITALPEETPVR